MKRLLVRGSLSLGLLAGVALILGGAPAGEEAAQDATIETPLGLPPIFWPEDNPYSPEKVELGRLLYFDKRLSSDNTVSCASCHEPGKAFTDSSPVSTGIGGQKGGRSARR